MNTNKSTTSADEATNDPKISKLWDADISNTADLDALLDAEDII